MTFDDNACIRYLMKEMDPSEEMLFEKRMLEDEDLLIEVESLRKVNQRLSDLPEMNPPSALTKKILQDASDHYNRKNRFRTRSVYLSAAATLLVLFISGAFWIYEEDRSAAEDTSASQAVISTNSPSFDLNIESSPNGIAPWVDQNQELHFNDRFDSENAATFDSIFHSSFERLRPLQSMERRNDRARNLHLTGQN